MINGNVQKIRPASYTPCQFDGLKNKTDIWIIAGSEAFKKAEEIEFARNSSDNHIIRAVINNEAESVVADGLDDIGNLRPLVVSEQYLNNESKLKCLKFADCHTHTVNIETAGQLDKEKVWKLAVLIRKQAGKKVLISHDGLLLQTEVIDIYGSSSNSSDFIEGKRELLPDELNRLRQMNERYTHVTIGGKHRVVSLKPCQVNGMAHSFESFDSFRSYFLDEPKIADMNPASAWLRWPGKNKKLNGIGFYPDPEKCPVNVFNLYQGRSVEPLPGDVEPYLNHLKQIICAGDEIAFQYLVGWLAHIIQKPDEKPSVAVVLKSIEGTGKGSMFEPIRRILGSYAVQVNGHQQITGKFNVTVVNKLLVFGDEVDLTNTAIADRLKGLISETTINLERKGIDPEPMPNYSRFIFASNHEHTISAGTRERRYLVLEPIPNKAQDKEYFDSLWQWINGNGPAYLLYYLLNYDLAEFDPRRAPATKALIAEKLASLKPAEAYLYEQIMSDKPFNGEARTDASVLVERFVEWCMNNGEEMKKAAARSSMGKAVKRLGIEVKGRSDRGVGKRWYDWPRIEELEIRFAKLLGHESTDVF